MAMHTHKEIIMNGDESTTLATRHTVFGTIGKDATLDGRALSAGV